MTKSQRQKSLALARRACGMLAQYATGECPAAYLSEEHREYIACLIEEFGRLDKNAQRPKAGRPRTKHPSANALAVRRWRENQRKKSP